MKIEINIPTGTSGPWTIETIEISEQDAKLDRIRALMNDSDRFTPPGTYKRLICGKNTVMSNTPDEIRDHYPLYRNAGGQVLINGLGLGVCIEMILEKVWHITVIEKSEDVIKLVGPYYRENPKVTIIHADAFDFKPPKGVKYNAVWHDVWNAICIDNLPEMALLHRKYGRITEWQGSWKKPYLQNERRKEKREMDFYNLMFPKNHLLDILKERHTNEFGSNNTI